jgi:DHA2 family multidrug resistance protein
LVFLAYSLYLNHFLSLYSEHGYIMLSLYVRGVGLGLVFTPLSSMALAEIPRAKMAQASGLFNVIRQIGGSFGVALLGTLLSRRTIYHLSAYGQAVDSTSPLFQQTVLHLQHFAQNAVGGTLALSGMRANAVIASYIGQQAFVQAVNDDFFIAAIITLAGAIPIVFLHTRRQRGGEKAAAID